MHLYMQELTIKVSIDKMTGFETFYETKVCLDMIILNLESRVVHQFCVRFGNRKRSINAIPYMNISVTPKGIK